MRKHLLRWTAGVCLLLAIISCGESAPVSQAAQDAADWSQFDDGLSGPDEDWNHEGNSSFYEDAIIFGDGTSFDTLGGFGDSMDFQGWETPPPEPCEVNEDCAKGLCVDLGTQRVCASECNYGCPHGWTCRLFDLWPEFPVKMCLPDDGFWCRPCDSISDCRRFPNDPFVACRDIGPDGALACTLACLEDDECKAGMTCGDSGFCEPEGVCDCRLNEANIGAISDCNQTNEEGTCYGTQGCDEDGWIPCDAPRPEAEICDGHDNNCNGHVDEDLLSTPCTKENIHGICSGETTCMDGIAMCLASEPKEELCDGADNNCNGEADEGCDLDGDGYCHHAPLAYGPSEVCQFASVDCDDSSAEVHPSMPELCDGRDNNCDGVVDNGCDPDGDGYCEAPLVWGANYVCRFPETDCDPLNKDVYPGAEEACNGVDNDCDGETDEGCDLDGDGYCDTQPLVWGESYRCKHPFPDCNDSLATVHPGMEEVCNARDDNCDGVKDEGCDLDGDGYCEGVAPEVLAGCQSGTPMQQQLCTALFYQESCLMGFGDCDDTSAFIHPGALEGCNGADDDCDGAVDNGLDVDGDGYCAWGVLVTVGCAACLNGAGDCDDGNAAVHPQALDLPDSDGIDANCDGVDGDLENCVFVAGWGSDSWSGTTLWPKKTLQGALEDPALLYSMDGCIVLDEEWEQYGSFEITQPMHIWGGYDSLGGWKPVVGGQTRIEGPSPVFSIEGVSGLVTLGRLDIVSEDAEIPGANSVAVSAIDSYWVEFTQTTITAGAGVPGEGGTNGFPGEDGEEGEDGADGCYPNPTCAYLYGHEECPQSANGGGHLDVTCGGRGQGLNVYLPVGWDGEFPNGDTWSSVYYGEPSCCFRFKNPYGYGGAPGDRGPEEAHDGGAGFPGATGTNGSFGLGGEGTLSWKGDSVAIGDGNDGGDGEAGCGGGGGGMGDNWDSTWSCEQKGGGGGGGGEGGRGGKGGTGGKAGGSSIGILLRSTTAVVRLSTIQTSDGGKGGKGGEGGKSGKGGKGGQGGSGLGDSGDGGNGGWGANGGRGGCGGGGAGGLSVGIVTSADRIPGLDEVTFVLGIGGEGGMDGTPGGYSIGYAYQGDDGDSQEMVVIQ